MNFGKDTKPVFDFSAVFEPSDYLYFYKDVLTEEITKKQIAFLVKELNLDKPLKILDLACGYGRHANLLVELGHKVVGVDITKGFIDIAKSNAKQKDVRVEYLLKDMREFSFKEEFDRAINIFTSFGYFEDEDNFKVLKNVANALKPDGLLCFDTFNRDSFLKTFLPYIVTEKEGNLMVDRNRFDSLTGCLYTNRIIIRNGKRRDASFFVRLYNPTEIRDLLKSAGLEISKVYADWDANPFTTESRRMIIVAIRRKF
jgi:SAM-dependent methyltransferase